MNNLGLKNQEIKYNAFFLKNKNEIEQFSKNSRLVDYNNQKEINNLTTKRNYIYAKKDTLLLKFSEKNPFSFYVLKDLSINLSFFGYKEIYDETFKNLSPKLKNTIWGINIKDKLFEMKNFSKGFIFPINKINNSVLVFNKKYTLVDFWFSYCQPCLKEIPIYKEIYQGYKDKGFNIISISTDRKKDIENWKKVININNILWENLLDENGDISKKYNINKFPTNFLLDFEGKIIKRDITQEELEKFLEKNLK
jgi:thiol-disulfide isomerase/thioredoxin